ncbi:MAG TPA: type II and III secretion system family protein [Patescibacteria group bacterium]|nr:type II and III secretion system family protein [Patescibacteria group bacterium]
MKLTTLIRSLSSLAVALALTACAQADVPRARDVNIPAPAAADNRSEAINEKPDSIMYLPLGEDMLIPQVNASDPLPSTPVGPFELRGETLAGALQLILADYNVPLAFQSDEGLTRRITVANLRGPMNKVVENVCSLANLYCAYNEGMLTVKDSQTFTVRIPPLSQDTSFMDNIGTGLAAIIGKAPIIDKSTRTIIYEATDRTAEMAERYFQRMRSNTALIVFETYIWEVALNSGNSTGINWADVERLGKFKIPLSVTGAVGADFSHPISIGLPHVGSVVNPTNLISFLSTYGSVKTISQPQITVLSGSQAKLRAADKQNFVSKISETLDNGQATTSVDTSSVDTGFTMTIDSAWDDATVYANIALSLTNVASIDNFNFSTGTTNSNSGNGGNTVVQLPKTTEREVNTQVRVRPGDSLLIAGLVRENDSLNSSGPGVTATPIVPTSRTATAGNLELVIMLRPRVIVFTSPEDEEYNRSVKGAAIAQGRSRAKDLTFSYNFSPLTGDSTKEKPAPAPAPVAIRPQALLDATPEKGSSVAVASSPPMKHSVATSVPAELLDPATGSVRQ